MTWPYPDDPRPRGSREATRPAIRCLVVEDDLDLAALWRLDLTDMGFDVTEAHSRAEAMTSLLIGEFDVVIADLRLPDGHGLDVAQMCEYRHPDCSVVIVTGGADYARGQIFAMCGNVAAIFRKAQEPRDLYAFIQHLVRKHAVGGGHSNSI